MHKDSVYVREILRAGARGYLVKDSDDDDLLKATRPVNRGEAFLSPAISDAVLTDYWKHVSNPTSREREILTLIAEGKTNKEAAAGLNLSVYTVESHCGSVMEKLNLHHTGDYGRYRPLCFAQRLDQLGAPTQERYFRFRRHASKRFWFASFKRG